jgi:uncharacterized protein
MPERTAYDPGTPSWVDLSTSDVDAARRFYGELFGWETEEAGPPEQTGGYMFFLKDGRKVAGLGPRQDESQPPAWTPYVSTDDADALAERARQAGGTVLFEPMDVVDAGRMALFAHQAAGVVGAWQPGQMIGAELVNEPGSLDWNELHTRDTEGAKAFLTSVFGWDARDSDFGGTTYTIFHLGEPGIAGQMQMPPGVPDEVPAYWANMFAVEDCDAALETLQGQGGTVRAGPMEMQDVGRFAYVSDPQGALFGVIALAPR